MPAFLTKQLNSCLLPDPECSIRTRTLSDTEPELVREPLCHPTELQRPTKYRHKGHGGDMCEEFVVIDHFTPVPQLPEPSLLDESCFFFFFPLLIVNFSFIRLSVTAESVRVCDMWAWISICLWVHNFCLLSVFSNESAQCVWIGARERGCMWQWFKLTSTALQRSHYPHLLPCVTQI